MIGLFYSLATVLVFSLPDLAIGARAKAVSFVKEVENVLIKRRTNQGPEGVVGAHFESLSCETKTSLRILSCTYALMRASSSSPVYFAICKVTTVASVVTEGLDLAVTGIKYVSGSI